MGKKNQVIFIILIVMTAIVVFSLLHFINLHSIDDIEPHDVIPVYWLFVFLSLLLPCALIIYNLIFKRETISKEDNFRLFARANLLLWTGVLLYRIMTILWIYRNNLPWVDEPMIINQIEHMIFYGRFFQGGILPSSINYHPEAIYPYSQYTLEVLLRTPFHILGLLLRNESIWKLAPFFYMLVLLGIFMPRLLKKGNEDYALVIGFSFAIFVSMDSVAQSFFRIRYFPFQNIAIFTCLLLLAHLFSKPISLKRIALMLLISVIPVFFHALGLLIVVSMLLGILVKVLSSGKVDILSLVKQSSVIQRVGVSIVLLFTVTVVIYMRGWLLNFISNILGNGFSYGIAIQYVINFTGPGVHLLIYLAITTLVWLNRKHLSIFLRSLFYLSVGGIGFSTFVAFATGNNDFAYPRYDLLGNMCTTIIVAIFLVLCVQCISNYLGERGRLEKPLKGILSTNISYPAFSIAIAIILVLSVSPARAHFNHLPVYFPSHIAPLTERIGENGIPYERVYILVGRPGYLYYRLQDTRIFMTDMPYHPELLPGESSSPPGRYGRNFRDLDGWFYRGNSYVFLGTIEDWYRLLDEIEAPEESYISFSVDHGRIDDDFSELLINLEVPNDFTPIPLSDIIIGMHSLGYDIPEHLLFLLYL